MIQEIDQMTQDEETALEITHAIATIQTTIENLRQTIAALVGGAKNIIVFEAVKIKCMHCETDVIPYVNTYAQDGVVHVDTRCKVCRSILRKELIVSSDIVRQEP